MKWLKRGLIIEPDKAKWWSQKYCMVPTPEFLEKENLIRIYYGTTDSENNGRTTFIDVCADDPKVIKYKHDGFIIDVGSVGMFDDSGVVPSSVLTVHNTKYLYYVGFHRIEKVPFMLFPGLAMADKHAINFIKYSNEPIIDRNAFNSVSNAAPFVINDGGLFKMWYWLGKEWTIINDKLYIKAVICYAQSIDGISWKLDESICIKPNPETEFSVGRPCVIKDNGLYKMWYSIRYIEKMYRIGYAESPNGKNWIRRDNEVGIDVSENGWDSEMICYSAVIKVKDKTYMFYNGNNNGETGFGFAELNE